MLCLGDNRKEYEIDLYPVRLIIAGGRDFSNYELLCIKLDSFIRNIDDRDIVKY